MPGSNCHRFVRLGHEFTIRADGGLILQSGRLLESPTLKLIAPLVLINTDRSCPTNLVQEFSHFPFQPVIEFFHRFTIHRLDRFSKMHLYRMEPDLA